MKPCRRWYASALFFLLAACITTQVSAQPAAEKPLVTTASVDPPGAPTLPKVLDLETAKGLALADNPGLRAIEARVNQAQARVRQARAAYFPTIAASASASKTWLAENDVRAMRKAAYQGGVRQVGSLGAGATTPAATTLWWTAARVGGFYARSRVDDTSEQYGASFAASWTLFDGFARRFTYAAAKHGAQEGEAAYDEARRILLDAVATAFYSVQLARENIVIADADQAFNLRQLKEAEARRRVGTGSLSDVLNFEVRVNAAKTALITATREHETALIGLAALLGLPDAAMPEDLDVEPLPSETPVDLDLPETEPLIETALAQRPDVRQLQKGIQRAHATAGAARGAYFPSVGLFASRDALLDDTQFGDEDFSTTVGATVSYTLFAGGRNRALVSEARQAEKEALRLLDDLEISVASEVRRALEELKAAQGAFVIQRENASLVQRNRDLVEKGYAVGQESLVRLNEAQRDLTQAQGNLALARVSLRQAWHNLETATGATLAPFSDIE